MSRLAEVDYCCDRNIAVLEHQPADQHISIKPRKAEKMSLTGTGFGLRGPLAPDTDKRQGVGPASHRHVALRGSQTVPIS
jgi:hypothetical protein